MVKEPSPETKARWKTQAALKGAIVPHYFEVFPHKVLLECGACKHAFSRPLIPHLNEPTFVCPQKHCKAKNWVPVYFDLL